MESKVQDLRTFQGQSAWFNANDMACKPILSKKVLFRGMGIFWSIKQEIF
jgi:hypothetical protein